MKVKANKDEWYELRGRRRRRRRRWLAGAERMVTMRETTGRGALPAADENGPVRRSVAGDEEQRSARVGVGRAR